MKRLLIIIGQAILVVILITFAVAMTLKHAAIYFGWGPFA